MIKGGFADISGFEEGEGGDMSSAGIERKEIFVEQLGSKKK